MPLNLIDQTSAMRLMVYQRAFNGTRQAYSFCTVKRADHRWDNRSGGERCQDNRCVFSRPRPPRRNCRRLAGNMLRRGRSRQALFWPPGARKWPSVCGGLPLWPSRESFRWVVPCRALLRPRSSSRGADARRRRFTAPSTCAMTRPWPKERCACGWGCRALSGSHGWSNQRGSSGCRPRPFPHIIGKQCLCVPLYSLVGCFILCCRASALAFERVLSRLPLCGSLRIRHVVFICLVGRRG